MRIAFGKNWQSFTKYALTQQSVECARAGFKHLFQGIKRAGCSFLDIGFKHGLVLCLAKLEGANVYGIDIEVDNMDALAATSGILGMDMLQSASIESILDTNWIEEKNGIFDIVHSWGVLHHTDDMAKAVRNAYSLVAPSGNFVCAIYDRRRTSPIWLAIKRLYNMLLIFGRRVLIIAFYPAIYFSKYLVTKRNPLAMNAAWIFCMMSSTGKAVFHTSMLRLMDYEN